MNPVPVLDLLVLPDVLAVCRLNSDEPLPAWTGDGPFLSITRAAEELSVVSPGAAVPAGVRCERGWRCLRVAGALDIGLVGVLASLVGPLAGAGISLFALSTFDTDHLLVRERDFTRAVEDLREKGLAARESLG